MGTGISPVRFKNFKLFIFVFIVFYGYATKIDAAATPPSCKEDCPSSYKKLSTNKLNLIIGNVYTYELTSDINVQLTGNDLQETTLKIHGQAQIYAETQCRYALKLNKVFIYGPDHKKNQLTNDLNLNKIIYFYLLNDELQPELCADHSDTEFSLNVKRSIISALQSADTKTIETDIFGQCPTQFTRQTIGEQIIVTKQRNLNNCGHRETLATGIINGIIDDKSSIKSMPLLNSDYSMEQRYKNGILINVQLSEDYQYLPYTNGDAGARAKVTTKLHLKSQQPVTGGDSFKQSASNNKLQRKTILFEKFGGATTTNPTTTNLQKIKQSLKLAIQNYRNNVGAKAANQFAELIRLIRLTKKDDLLALYQQVKAGTVSGDQRELARKIYFDAVFRAGTGDTVQVIANLLKNELNAKEQRLAYISLNLVKSLDETALAAINKLIDGNPPREAYLSVGNLVSKFCREHSCDHNEIKSITEKFVNKLGDCKSDTRKKESQTVAIIKGIKNMNHLQSPALDKIIECASNKYSERIRVAAIQTFSAAACNKKIQSIALALFKNSAEDSEIRIEAYLALTICPTGDIANEIKQQLDNENVYQVGSFVTTHLANLRSSTQSDRQLARQHFANIRTTQKFPSDIRRYSFNSELSYNLQSFGIGASIDTNVIYSQKEFLPRSSRFNLTGEIFGQNFNIIELAARQENMDKIFEHYFGPKGYFRTTTIQDVYGMVTNADDQHSRNPRSVKNNEINDDDLDYDLSVKLFGTEMYFLSLNENDNLLAFEQKDFLKRLHSCWEKMLTNAKGFEEKYENHALFMDADLIYPLGNGLPLKLSVQGASVIRLETSGKIDFKTFVNDPKFTLKIVPSYNIEISGSLSVDAYVVNTGIQVSGSLHSSTGAELDFALINDKTGVDVKFRLPQKKQELFSIDHKIVFITQERGQETVTNNLKFSSKKKEFNGCFDQLHKFIGATFCTDISVTIPTAIGNVIGTAGGSSNAGNTGVNHAAAALFPLNGPNKISIWLEVEMSYHFRMTYDADKDSSIINRSIELLFDTPDSDIKRLTIVKFEISQKPLKFIKINLNSSHRKASVESGIINDNNEMSIYVNAVNGPDQYYGKFGFNKNNKNGPDHTEYLPIVMFKTPNQNDDNIMGYKVLGKIVIDSSSGKGNRYQFDKIEIIGVQPANLVLNGWFSVEGTKFSTEMDFSQAEKNGKLIGYIEILQKHLKMDMGLITNLYQFGPDKSLHSKIVIDTEYADKFFKNNVEFSYGSDFSPESSRFELTQNYEYDINDSKQLVSLKFANKLNAPKIPTNIRIDGEYNKNNLNYLLEIGYSKYQIASNLNAKYNQKIIGDYDVVFGASMNSQNLKIILRRDVVDGDKSKLQNKLTTSHGTRIELNGIVSNRPTLSDTDINLEGILVASERQEPFKLNFVHRLTNDEINSNGKLLHGANNQLLSYDFTGKNDKINHNYNGQIKLMIKDLLNGNGAYKSANGIGDANIIIDMAKIQRKLKFDTKFTIIPNQTYNFHNEFDYNYEKSIDKKIIFDTKNSLAKNHKKIESLNQLTINDNELYEINAEYINDNSINNDIVKKLLTFNVILPIKRQLTWHYEIMLDKKLQINSMKNKFIDKSLQNPISQRSWTIDNKLSKLNLSQKLFELLTNIEYIDNDGKNVAIDILLKNVPIDKSHYNMAAGHLVTKGNLLPEILDLLISVDEYCNEHAVYRIQTKYGGKFNMNINGNYYIGGKTKINSYDLSALINIPQTNIKQIKFQSIGKFLWPQKSTDLYDGQFKIVGTLNDKSFSIDTNGKINHKHGSGSININLPDTDTFSVDSSYQLSTDNSNNDGDNTNSSEDSDSDEMTIIKPLKKSSANGVLTVKYGKGKQIKAIGDIKYIPKSELILHATLQTPFENGKNIDFTYKSLKSIMANTINEQYHINVDGKVYDLAMDLSLSNIKPSFNILIKYPNGNDIKLQTLLQRISERHYTGTLLIENFGTFNMASDIDTNYQNLDTFYLKLNVNAPTINIKQLHVELTAKKNEIGTKGIEFMAAQENKNILSGFADYTIKEEKGKTIIEGTGNVKLYDKEKLASFKFVRNTFDEGRGDGETGVHLVFNGLLGPQNIVLELRATNKIFHIRNTICEEKNQCINFEIKSQLKRNPDKRQFKHELIVAVDLRKFGYAYEFGLQSDTERNGYEFTHNFDVHLQSHDKTRYQYHVIIDNKKSSITLTLPQRIIEIDANYQLPKDIFGKYLINFSTNFNKLNKSIKRSIIGIEIDLLRPTKNSLKNRIEMKFGHPEMREMKIIGETMFNGDDKYANGKLQLDLFNDLNKAIIITGNFGNINANEQNELSMKNFNLTSELSVISNGLNIEYSFNGHIGGSLLFPANNKNNNLFSIGGQFISPNTDLRIGTYLYGNDNHLQFIVIGFNDELINLYGEYDTNKMNGKITINYKTFGDDKNNLVTANFIINGMTSFVGKLEREKIIKLNGEFSVGKEANIFITAFADKELFSGKIALDQTNFLTCEYKIDDKNIDAFVKQLDQQIKRDRERGIAIISDRIKNVETALTKQMANIRDSIPDFTPIINEYKGEWKQLMDELMADKTIKEFLEFYNRVWGTFGKVIVECVNVLAENSKKIYEIFNDFYQKIHQAFNEKILPALKETYTKFDAILQQIYENTIKLLSSLFQRLANALKAFENDFRKIGQTLSDTFKHVAQLFMKLFDSCRKEIYDFYKFARDSLQQLPGSEYFMAKLSEISGGIIVPENLINILHEITNTLKDSLPTKELNEFVQMLATYVENKLTQKKNINDYEQIKLLYVNFIKAIRSIYDLIRQQSGNYIDNENLLNVNNFPAINGHGGHYVPFVIDIIKSIPASLATIKFSLWNLLQNNEHDLPTIRELFYTYRPYGFNPINIIPPFVKHGIIIDGIYGITYDQKEVTLPTTATNDKCQYIITRDNVNNNFSIIATINSNKLTAIKLTDKNNENFIEINDKLLLFTDDSSGKNIDLPYHRKNLHSWRTYNTITLLSKYGCTITCTLNLRICHITINGYYHNQLIGIFGNGNYELYDDDKLINIGKQLTITKKYQQFLDTYQLTKETCKNQQNEHVEHHQHDDGSKSMDCRKLFSWDSSLRTGYLFVNPMIYRDICEHAMDNIKMDTNNDKDDILCNIARAYASTCYLEHIPIKIPNNCDQCMDNKKINDKYQSIAPQKQADIIFVIDTSIFAQSIVDMIQQLLNDIKRELKLRDINDIHISIIGYNDEQKYYHHLTTNGQLDFNGKLSAYKFDDAPKVEKPKKTGNEIIDKYMLNGWELIRSIEKDLGIAADGKAFQEAMSYPFRSTASNVIIAIRPDHLEFSTNPTKSIGASLSNSLAQFNGITIHLIAPVRDLSLTKDAKNTKNIVGFNSKTVVQMSDGRKRTNIGSSELRNQLNYKSDLGIDLVQQGDGYVFNLDNYQQLKGANEKKQFVKIIANTLADQISRTEISSDCVCKLKSGLFAHEVCVAGDKKLLPAVKRPAQARG